MLEHPDILESVSFNYGLIFKQASIVRIANCTKLITIIVDPSTKNTIIRMTVLINF